MTKPVVVIDDTLTKVREVESHLHNRERWLGKRAVQDATDWGSPTSINPFVAISGSGAYGADANDEALVIGTGDTPLITGTTNFDIHRLLITDVDHGTPYKLRVVYGTGTMADAITANQYSEVMVQFDAVNPQLSAGVPVDLIMPRLDCGSDQVWIQAWNATDNSEIDFTVGLHEYIV